MKLSGLFFLVIIFAGESTLINFFIIFIFSVYFEPLYGQKICCESNRISFNDSNNPRESFV